MSRLIHLNGPPGIAKSTLSARYADRHPGTLNLDADVLHRLIGEARGEQTRPWQLAWRLAKAMAGMSHCIVHSEAERVDKFTCVYWTRYLVVLGRYITPNHSLHFDHFCCETDAWRGTLDRTVSSHKRKGNQNGT